MVKKSQDVHLMRLRKVKNLEARLDTCRGRLLLEKEPICFQSVFGNDHPVIAEFGIGRGKFILEMAKRYPEKNFFGVERVDSVMIQAMEKVREEKNIRYLIANVEDLVEILPDNSLSGLFLNFSDPWPKKRNRKRRLTYRDYLKQYDRWLIEGSTVQLKTDSDILFAFSIEEVSQTGHILRDVTLDVSKSSAYEDNIRTEYEERFAEQEMPIRALRYDSGKALL